MLLSTSKLALVFVPLLLVCKAAVALPNPGDSRSPEGDYDGSLSGSPVVPPCCPDPPLSIGLGPVCTPCDPPPTL
ncbi:hypothetical protein BD779DRAFT_1547305 [Infundibulicybe gibba]|nr:hypothetical protein BD779DRAFT_1547305 [Infundibulicybe gibba]